MAVLVLNFSVNQAAVLLHCNTSPHPGWTVLKDKTNTKSVFLKAKLEYSKQIIIKYDIP